jgi:hypothetical protein
MQATNPTSDVNGNQPKHSHEDAAKPSESPAVTPEERRRLAQCCAFFKAEQFRAAEPETIRASDVRNAEHEIDRLIENCRRRAGSARHA